MTGTTYIVMWAVAFVFFVVVEVANGAGLFSIWFAVASIIAMFFAIAKAPFVVQLAAFVVGSIVLLLVTRPLAKRVQKKTVPTNYELDVGQTAVVIEGIDNTVNKGRVKLNGTDWSARSVDGRPISNGSTVTVVQVSGAKLIVSDNNK
ncbi:MAG: NfeD family protein [Ruminococcus sp.]|nr:NfeD family protein [Ruminococcus sp.]